MIRIAAYNSEQWAVFSKTAHQLVFETPHEPDEERITFALLAVDEDTEHPVGYLTAREMNASDVCWEFGGAFPDYKGTASVFRAYTFFARWCQTRYKRVFQVVENTNRAYFRLALQLGFQIVGMRFSHGKVLVELLLEF